jgi:anaerobic magnesium-protoporphyrin IX monomethyl ester cyclase
MSGLVRVHNAYGDSPAARTRDVSRPVMLVGFREQENLGLGYLTSTLRSYGYRVEVFDFQEDRTNILEAVRALKPILIGFSLIFQFYIDRFGALVRYLRDRGIDCHFTMGGHFPSLSYESTLELIPELDSVVRFEGELTLLDLVDLLSTGRDWRDIRGIAYRQGGEVIATPSRPLIQDLDQLPYPERSLAPRALLGRATMPLLASRGCIRTCSFCSIHVFYRSVPGKVVRTRNPAQVVREMRMLHSERGITIFLFQDDDFPVFGPVWRRWAKEFVDELHRNGLPGRVVWKISCRADAVDPELFAAMRDAGLFMVYMGLESGSEEGLKTLHKQITVEQNIRAVEILKGLGLMFQFGFMLFEPSTTFESVRENLHFLRTIVGDGSTAATFCRMVPYDGTPIKDELLRTGRLRGDVCHPDYDFLDPTLTDFYHALCDVVETTGWIHGIHALSPQLNFAWSELAVMERLYPPLAGLADYKDTLREITRASNDLLFRVVEDMSYVFSKGTAHVWSAAALEAECKGFRERFLEERNTFVLRNQAVLLQALEAPPTEMETAYA